MIRLQRLTPEVYYNQSRDFQFIGRLYDLVLNSVKTNSDLLYGLPLSEDSDDALLDLLSMTLGFKSLHNYNVNQLRALCESFAEIIRNKGNIQSIEKACNALLGAEGITDQAMIEQDTDKQTIIVYISQELSDTNLLRDLFNYILPAGMSYSIVKTLKYMQDTTTETAYKDIVTKAQLLGSTTGKVVDNTSADVFANKVGTSAGSIFNTTLFDDIQSTSSTNNEVNE